MAYVLQKSYQAALLNSKQSILANPTDAFAITASISRYLFHQSRHKPCDRHGDSLRSGWKNILACIMRLFQLDLLPPVVLLIDCEDSAAAKERLPRPSASRKNPATASLLSRAFSRCPQLKIIAGCLACILYI